jgi:hypothetical protein
VAGTTELIPLDRVQSLANSLKQTASEISFQLTSPRGEDIGGSGSFVPPVTSLSGDSLPASPGKSLLFAGGEPE